jgi:hypothetical protein
MAQVQGVLKSAALELPSTAFSVSTTALAPACALLRLLPVHGGGADGCGAFGAHSAGGVLMEPRLLPSSAAQQAGAAGEAIQLLPQPRGSLGGLVPAAVDASAAALAPGQIGLRVQAVGLNFRDVLNVRGGGARALLQRGVKLARAANVCLLLST